MSDYYLLQCRESCSTNGFNTTDYHHISSLHAPCKEGSQCGRQIQVLLVSSDGYQDADFYYLSSAQIGAALQRYPYVRLFALLYMVSGCFVGSSSPIVVVLQILLHVWVMVILFTYKPEAHSTEL